MSKRTNVFLSGELNSSNVFPEVKFRLDKSLIIKNVYITRLVINGLKISGTAPDCIPSSSHFHLNVTDESGSDIGRSDFVLREINDTIPGFPIPMSNEKFLNLDFNPPVKIAETRGNASRRTIGIKFTNDSSALLSTTTELTNGARYALWLIIEE